MRFEMVYSGINYQGVDNQFDVSLDSIGKILDTRNRYEQGKKIMPSAQILTS